ncbi:MAG: hypothetical protein WEB52_10180 [Dehalococcoidia bacterium]
MRRELLILDVTAMAGDNVCVAGLDLESRTTIRLNQPQPTRSGLKALGGLTPGEVIAVDVEPLAQTTRPHVEDHQWNPRSVEKFRRMDNAEILGALTGTEVRSLKDAFGEPSRSGKRHNAGWKPGEGERSLATLRVRYVRQEEVEAGKIRIDLRDNERYWHGIPFQDVTVREHGTSCETCSAGFLDLVRTDFEANACLVRVGLTRRFPPDEHDDGSACWLQVTNIFARDRAHFF